MNTFRTEVISGSVPDRVFHPVATIKCQGPLIFRSQVARDAACLFDLDREVASWTCSPPCLEIWGDEHRPDFALTGSGGGVVFVDIYDRPDIPARVDADSACPPGVTYTVIERDSIEVGYRLENARDLLRYGNHRTPLGDRVALLRALDEQGSLSVAECLTAFRETRPMAGLASLILGGFVDVDLDEGLLGPETMVRRIGT